jgi:hypothetical protein
MMDAIRHGVTGDEPAGATPGRTEDLPVGDAGAVEAGLTGGAAATEPGVNAGVSSGTRCTATQADLTVTEAAGSRPGG